MTREYNGSRIFFILSGFDSILQFTDVISNNGKVSKDTNLAVKFGAKESWKINDSAIVDLKIEKEGWFVYYPVPSFLFSTLASDIQVEGRYKFFMYRIKYLLLRV